MTGPIETARQQPPGHIRPLPLVIAIVIMIAITVWPVMLTTADGKADHWTAMILFWSMSAGFVSGVGFQPRFPLWRWLFSQWSCLLALMLATLNMVMH